MSVCDFERMGSNDPHVGNNTSKDYKKKKIKKKKNDVARAFDLESPFAAKEGGLQPG